MLRNCFQDERGPRAACRGFGARFVVESALLAADACIAVTVLRSEADLNPHGPDLRKLATRDAAES